jgi:hypothetical protein
MEALKYLEVYDDSVYAVTFINEDIAALKTSQVVDILSSTNNPVKLSVILEKEPGLKWVKSNQRQINRIVRLAQKTNRIVVLNQEEDRMERRLFPYILVSAVEQNLYQIADIFSQPTQTPKSAFKNLLNTELKNMVLSK